MYRAIEHFTDLQDNRHEYTPGDEFPRSGLEVSNARLDELSTGKNKRNRPVIELVEEAKEIVKDEVKEDIMPQEPVIVEEKPKKTTRKRTKKSAD